MCGFHLFNELVFQIYIFSLHMNDHGLGISVVHQLCYVLQGKLVKKDFNIMEAAGGVGKNFTVEDKNVLVNGSTLEIHLYWAGKGTTAVPDRGVYGPLISAITVTPSKFFPALLDGLSLF